MRLRDSLSPCSIDAGKGARRHRCSVEHATLVEGYRDARHAWEERREAWALGYATESREYAERTGDRAPTLKRFLKSWRGGVWGAPDEEGAA